MALLKKIRLFIFLLDYEKAFDFTNRVKIAKQLAEDNIGNRTLQNFINMYTNTSYVAKISNNEVGPEITTKHGLTQGKNSSATLFSYYVSDMPHAIDDMQPLDYFDPLNLLQVADDTTSFADSKISLTKKAEAILDYSKLKYLGVNIDKTKYMEMCDNPDLTSMCISDDVIVEAVQPSKGYCWLGFWLSYADNVPSLIKTNLNKKSFHICKFYGWLQINKQTPIIIKLTVLYSCMFAAILYSCETWGNIDIITEQLLIMERKALKSCLGVKSSITNDIIYQELNLPDIIAKIIKQQYQFFAKIMGMDPAEAIIKKLIDKYTEDADIVENKQSFLLYYLRLQADSTKNNTVDRKTRLENGDTSMVVRYRDLTNLEYANVLYNSFVNDEHRITITRWRLSCHKLHIETGRYKHPKTPRTDRLCKICLTVEDEHHALFCCLAHTFIRVKYFSLLSTYNTVNTLLNPKTSGDIVKIGAYIAELEDNMKKLRMC